jgi:ComF family protein
MLRAAALHTEPLRGAIHTFKYEDRPELARPLARYLTAAFDTADWQACRCAIDAVVAVPLHDQRRAERGYNQAELLAVEFAHAVDLACRPNWIERHACTRPQVGLSADERRVNVEQAFAAHPEVAGRTLLLIDDVYTTGSTFNACAAAAVAAGARAVYALALAIPPSNRRPGEASSGDSARLSQNRGDKSQLTRANVGPTIDL